MLLLIPSKDNVILIEPMHLFTYKQSQALLFISTLIALLASYYLQHIHGLQPCPLCLMQRFCIFILMGVVLLSFFTNRAKGPRISSYIQILVAAIGLYFAFRQLWLQSFPLNEAPACMPQFSILIRYFSWSDITKAFLWGASDCAEVTWTFLGLSLPAWTALYFFFVLFLNIISLRNLSKNGNYKTVLN